jgi:type II secretory pathway pseudopilin PulG
MKVMLLLLIGIAAVVFSATRLYIKEAKRQKKRREAIRAANEAMEKSVKEAQRIKSTPPVMPAVGESAAQ